MWPRPAASAPRTPVPRDVTPRHADPPRRRLAQPGDRLHELGLPVAVHPGQADDLAGTDLERQAPHGREAALVEHLEILHREQRLAGAALLLVQPEEHLAADHEPREARLRGALGRDRVHLLAPPQHRHPVGDLEHLAQLVRDEDHGHALARERAEDLEQLGRLLGGEDGRRLVQDEDVRAAVQDAQDLHPLLLADADVLHPRPRVDVEAERLRQLPHAPLGAVHIEQRALARLGGEHDVLRHRHDRDEHEVLVHHADPEPDRLARRADADRLAAEADLALVGLMEPVEDVHERRLARPVLPEQGVHLALAQVEVDAVVRDQRAEALGDALELEGQGGGGVQGATARCRGCRSACPRRSASRAR
jgi:hypothetical protein